MAILGIDYEKCNNCQICVSACYVGTRCLRLDNDQNKIVFDDRENLCYLCGRCISTCPADAILHENMGESLDFEGDQDPYKLISYETMQKFLSSKRSIRGFKNKKIPKIVMEKVLNSIKCAPTGGNIRTLKCTIISDDIKIKKLSNVVMDFIIASSAPEFKTYREEGYKRYREQGIDRIFFNAPHIMIIHSDNPGDAMNAPIGLTYGMLSAQSLGLGSCWIGLAHGILASNKEIREIFVDIQDKIWGVIILGYPNDSLKSYRSPPRPDLKTKGLEELL